MRQPMSTEPEIHIRKDTPRESICNAKPETTPRCRASVHLRCGSAQKSMQVDSTRALEHRWMSNLFGLQPLALGTAIALQSTAIQCHAVQPLHGRSRRSSSSTRCCSTRHYASILAAATVYSTAIHGRCQQLSTQPIHGHAGCSHSAVHTTDG